MDSRYPSIEMLADRAKKRMPGFAYGSKYTGY